MYYCTRIWNKLSTDTVILSAKRSLTDLRICKMLVQYIVAAIMAVSQAETLFLQCGNVTSEFSPGNTRLKNCLQISHS